MTKIKVGIFFVIGILILTMFSGCITKTTYMVEMRDGIKLATDVYLPDDDNPHRGAILVRTPYNKDKIQLLGYLWANEGWPTVIQDTRGRFASEGRDTVFRNAHTDGPDTVEWIASQNWSNGMVATQGGSAAGIVQYYMAGANPEHLTCQFIAMASPNLYKDAIYPGGEFRKNMMEKWLQKQGSTYILPELWEHENYTMDYWTNVSLEDNWQDVNVPAMHMGGWYDIFTQGIIDGFMGYNYLGGDGARGKSKLIMGPWTHGGPQKTKQGQLTYPENCIDTFSNDMFWEMVSCYNTDNGSDDFLSRPTVLYYVMGDVDDIDAPGNEWRTADAWPIPHTDVCWYLHRDGTLSKEMPDRNDEPIIYRYDPADPVPTVGGGNLKMAAGPFDQSSVENRSDVLVFTSPVLEAPYEATGHIKAILYVSSDCPDTDFTVKLTDVYPDGRSMLIQDGILRMRFRNGFDHWEFMQPGEIYRIEVDLWSTSYIWNTGHRIRVDISSSNYPRFLNNPNTRDGVYKNTTYNIANNTIYLDSEHPSCIVLPEIPMSAVQSNPPQTPKRPHSIGKIKTDSPVVFSTTSKDPDGDKISYVFDWGDGTSSGWTMPQKSGKTVKVQHVYKKAGLYSIRVKAKDDTGAQSGWSKPLLVFVKKGSSKQSKKTTEQTAQELFEKSNISDTYILTLLKVALLE